MIYIDTFIGLELEQIAIGKLKNWTVVICNDNTYIFTNLNKPYINRIKREDEKEFLKKTKRWKRGSK